MKILIFQDHQYALDPVQVKKKLTEAQERVEELQRELRNAKDRERRLKKTVKFLINDLRHKNLLTKDLQQDLDSFCGWLNCITLSVYTTSRIMFTEILVSFFKK